MKQGFSRRAGFTLVELLTVIAVISILAGLLLPALARARMSSQRAICTSNVKQVSLAVIMYAADNRDLLPATTNVTWNDLEPDHFAIFYKRLMKSYVGLTGPSSARDKVFDCPADKFFYNVPSLDCVERSLSGEVNSDFSSYGFNGNVETNPLPPAFLPPDSYGGLSGRTLASLKDPGRTLLVTELSAYFPWSWHESLRLPPGKCGVNDARSLTGFADGHVSYIKFYWNANLPTTTCSYEPPAGYDYKWHAD